jgi:DNA ligase (NAD+)
MRYSAEDQQKLFTRSKQLLNQPSERSPEEAISQLRELIEYHEYRYYILNDTVVSDYE